MLLVHSSRILGIFVVKKSYTLSLNIKPRKKDWKTLRTLYGTF
jgi:hypothetical protein